MQASIKRIKEAIRNNPKINGCIEYPFIIILHYQIKKKMNKYHKPIKDLKTLNEAAIQVGDDYTIYHDMGNGSINLIPDYCKHNPISKKWQSVSLEWVKGYLEATSLPPSVFQLIYNRELHNQGSFDNGLYALFLLGGEGNRKALIKAFPNFFNPGDEKLEW